MPKDKKLKKISLSARTKISLGDFLAAAQGGSKISLEAGSLKILAARRAEIERKISRTKEPTYGFNRGFGHNVDQSVPEERLKELQINLIRSHSSGVGSAAPRAAVRGAMFLRAASLVRGYSGVRPEVPQKIVEFLNKDVCPAVPLYGSVGASGDLAPLSHIALCLIGEGQVLDQAGRAVSTKKELRRKGIKPLSLEMKEGLALNNGVQYSNSLGLLALSASKNLINHAVLAAAISNQVFLGSDSAYDADLLALRPHRGAAAVGGWLRKLMKGSPLREAHRDYAVDGAVQDPYNLRCAPQILGAALDLIEEAEAALLIEANSVTDNPLILPEVGSAKGHTRVVSGGHFHGMPIAVKIYGIIQALSIICTLSNVRAQRYVDQHRNKGMPSDLVWPGLGPEDLSASSGMMIPEYVSAALANSVWGLSMPSHLFSLSTDAGQEDHVSMSANLALRALEAADRTAEALGIELAFGAQAAAIRKVSETIPSRHITDVDADLSSLYDGSRGAGAKRESERFLVRMSANLEYRLKKSERSLSPACEDALKAIYSHFPAVKRDRPLSSQLNKLAEAVKAGEIIGAISKHVVF